MMDQKEMLELAQNNKIGLDDEFCFDCLACGECCRNRDDSDILLTPRDIFQIAGCLQLTPKEVTEKYCESHIGQNSKLPIIRIKPKIHNGVCPFLRKGFCSIHSSKPLRCAIFPLGRYLDTRIPDSEFTYFVQPISCGSKTVKHSVRDWLQGFDISAYEKVDLDWVRLTNFVTEFIYRQEVKDETRLEPLWNLLYPFMYLNYDTSKDFESQFNLNRDIIKRVITDYGLDVKRFFEKIKP